MNNQNPKINDLSTYRRTTLSELHQGEMEIDAPHPLLRFFLKSAFILNGGGLFLLWLFFRFLDFFPPHDMPFLPAFAWYFFFGGVYAVFAFFSFRFSVYVERAAIQRSLTHNRRYEWHKLQAAEMSEEELNKMPRTVDRPKAVSAVGAGSRYFRMTAFLILASLLTCFLGVLAFIRAPL